MLPTVATFLRGSSSRPAFARNEALIRKSSSEAEERRQGDVDRASGRPARRSDHRALSDRRRPRIAARPRFVNLAAASVAELREAMEARRCDPVSVLLGRYAQSLTAAGEVDGELALSFVLFPSEAMLEAVAEVGSHRATVA